MQRALGVFSSVASCGGGDVHDVHRCGVHVHGASICRTQARGVDASHAEPHAGESCELSSVVV